MPAAASVSPSMQTTKAPELQDSAPGLRLDRLATLYVFHPLRRWSDLYVARIPILMYHSISNQDERGRHAYYRTSTRPEVFAEHLRILREENFETVSLSDAVERLHGSGGTRRKCVVITFDDGFEDFYTNAFPILNEFGCTATVFLPTAYISEANASFVGIRCLNWKQVRELDAAGIEFGSHTVTHPQLKTLGMARVQTELGDSKRTIEEQLGHAIHSFSYPYAFPETDRAFRGRLKQILEEEGYQNGVSTIIGTARQSSDRYFLERLPVNSCDDSRLFSVKLQGAYDWMHVPQYLSKLSTRNPNQSESAR